MDNKFGFEVTVEMRIMLDRELTTTDKILYIIISSLSKNKGNCFANNDYLANVLNSTSRQVQRCLQKLKEKGYIVIEYDNNKRKIMPSLQRISEIRDENVEDFKKIFEYDWLHKEQL